MVFWWCSDDYGNHTNENLTHFPFDIIQARIRKIIEGNERATTRDMVPTPGQGSREATTSLSAAGSVATTTANAVGQSVFPEAIVYIVSECVRCMFDDLPLPLSGLEWALAGSQDLFELVKRPHSTTGSEILCPYAPFPPSRTPL